MITYTNEDCIDRYEVNVCTGYRHGNSPLNARGNQYECGDGVGYEYCSGRRYGDGKGFGDFSEYYGDDNGNGYGVGETGLAEGHGFSVTTKEIDFSRVDLDEFIIWRVNEEMS